MKTLIIKYMIVFTNNEDDNNWIKKNSKYMLPKRKCFLQSII